MDKNLFIQESKEVLRIGREFNSMMLALQEKFIDFEDEIMELSETDEEIQQLNEEFDDLYYDLNQL